MSQDNVRERIIDMAFQAMTAATPEEQERRVREAFESLQPVDWSLFVQQCWLIKNLSDDPAKEDAAGDCG